MKLLQASFATVLLSLGLLLILSCQYHFSQLKARGELLLCLKKSKGEIHRFISRIEETNWAIKHIDKAKYLVFIPGLQAVAANTERAKHLIQQYQSVQLIRFMAIAVKLQKRCKQPKTLLGPYELSGMGLKRNFEGMAIRRQKWAPVILGKYQTAKIKIQFPQKTQRTPKVHYQYSINRARPLLVGLFL